MVHLPPILERGGHHSQSRLPASRCCLVHGRFRQLGLRSVLENTVVPGSMVRPVHCGTVYSSEGLFPIVLASLLWGRIWHGLTVLCRCDNGAVIEVVNRQSACGPLLCHLLRCLFYASARLDLEISAQGHLMWQRMHYLTITSASFSCRCRMPPLSPQSSLAKPAPPGPREIGSTGSGFSAARSSAGYASDIRVGPISIFVLLCTFFVLPHYPCAKTPL